MPPSVQTLLKDPPSLAKPSPPNGLPPLRTGGDAPPGGPRRRIALAAVLALLVGVAAGGGVALYLASTDDSHERAEAAVLAGSQAVEESAEALRQAAKLDEVAEAGETASVAVGDTERALAETDSISDPGYRDPVDRVLKAELTLLTSLASLEDLREGTVDEWQSMRRSIRAAVLEVADVQAAVDSLDFSSEPVLPGPAVSTALDSANRVVSTADRKLRKWRSKAQEIRSDKRGELAVMNGYADSMRTYLTTYNGLRTDLDEWIQRVDTEGATFNEAYEFLGNAYSERQRVRSGIGALDAPAPVASAHVALLDVMDRAMAAVDSATTGISEYEWDFEGEYSYYTETPGWQTFSSESDAIAGDSGSARSSWDAAVAGEIVRIESRKLPKKPEV
jgi:hypothetical protein